MRCVVRAYWQNGSHSEQTMPQEEVVRYLTNLPTDILKAYTVELAGEPPFAVPFKSGDEVITDGGHTGVFIGTDPKYPDHYVVRLTGFRADYVLILRDGLQKAGR